MVFLLVFFKNPNYYCYYYYYYSFSNQEQLFHKCILTLEVILAPSVLKKNNHGS